MPAIAQPPYLGSAYYPEAWPAAQGAEDVALMKRAGMTVARLGEFAWSTMEPESGRYEFGWLHDAIDRLANAGIAVVLGTPTCTPPLWLAQRHPEILAVGDDGVTAQHGARRHACPTSPVYRGHCRRIAERMAREFAAKPNLVGWQIDNEVYPQGRRGCCCASCTAHFRQAMRAKFGTIEALNEAWCLALWSQQYGSFDDLCAPRGDTWHHPSLLAEWMLAQSEAFAEFVEEQAEVLHALAPQPVGTDMMPLLGVDYRRIHRSLDLVQFNHYHDPEDLWDAALWMDWCRTLKPRPFWNTETSADYPGNTVSCAYRGRGYSTVNSWLPVALGGEANMYWLWRVHRAGQELMHGGVVTSAGRPGLAWDEIRGVADGFARAGEFLRGTTPDAGGIAIHQSTRAWWCFSFQPILTGNHYARWLSDWFYRPVARAHFRPDVIDPAAELDRYRVVFSPMLANLDEGGLRQRLLRWIEDGGTWIAGPWTDIRDSNFAKFAHGPFGSLEEWTGVRCVREVPAGRPIAMRWEDGGAPFAGEKWCCGFDPRGAERLATCTGEPLEGLAGVVRVRRGKGTIILLGTFPSEPDLARLVAEACAGQGIPPAAKASPNVLVVPRSGGAGRGAVVLEMHNQPGTLTLPEPCTDLLTGRRLAGEVAVAPFSVLVPVPENKSPLRDK
jgi:beta-galactosidase GanA